MWIDLAEIEKLIAGHDAEVDIENCPHCCRNGDNYGESCRHCGKQLAGYGNGGWFGSNLTGTEKCLHDWTDSGDGQICRFCERYEPFEEISNFVN